MGRRKGVIYAKYEEPEQPEPGDYIKDLSARGSTIDVSRGEEGFLGNFPDEDVADKAIREDMLRRNWYPNVWRLSDHGNLFLEKFRGPRRPKEKPTGVLE